MNMEQLFGENIGTGELKALRRLLNTHRNVGVDFHVEDGASVTLVWPTEAGENTSSAPWIISENVIGVIQFKALLRTLFIEGQAIKVLHHVGDLAHWMATHGLTKAARGVRSVVDLQLFYEHVVDPRERVASLTKIIAEHTDSEAGSSTLSGSLKQDIGEELYRGLLSRHFSQNGDTPPTTNGSIKTKPHGDAAAISRTLLQHSVQRAHLCLMCFDRVVTKRCLNGDGKDPTTTMAELQSLTLRRLVLGLHSPAGHARIWFDKCADYLPRSMECLGDETQLLDTIPLAKFDCDIESLLALLPSRLHQAIMAVNKFEERLTTICLDVGKKPLAYIDKGDAQTQRVELFKELKGSSTTKALFGAFSRSKQTKTENLLRDELDGIVAMLGGEGKIDSSNRASFDCQLHRIAVVRSKTHKIIGVTMRVGRHLEFASHVLLDLLLSTTHRRKSVLILGNTGAGKTTLLRDIARCLSSSDSGASVCIVDTSNEIGGDGSLPHHSIGLARRMAVQSLRDQANKIVECVQNHSVDVLLVDELGLKDEVGAIAFATKHCHRVIAGICYRDLEELVNDREMNRLVGGMEVATPKLSLFESPAELKRRTAKPLIDVVVELDATRRGVYHIIWDVAQAVDNVMRGRSYTYETRCQSIDIHGVQALRPSVVNRAVVIHTNAYANPVKLTKLTVTQNDNSERQYEATMGKFLEGAMKPGSRQFVILLNCVLGLLFSVMLTVVYTELENSLHVFVLLFIIAGLTVSINWFIIEANKLKAMQHTESATPVQGGDKAKLQAARAKTD